LIANTPRLGESGRLGAADVFGSAPVAGIIGEYLGRVFLEVKRRPPFLIARVSGGLAEDDEHPQEQTDG